MVLPVLFGVSEDCYDCTDDCHGRSCRRLKLGASLRIGGKSDADQYNADWEEHDSGRLLTSLSDSSFSGYRTLLKA